MVVYQTSGGLVNLLYKPLKCRVIYLRLDNYEVLGLQFFYGYKRIYRCNKKVRITNMLTSAVVVYSQ